ncbi:NADH-ubiquinone oxidoreductase chain 2 [Artemisia annua]|uniref:ATP-dependent DNA helicase n=1 Tax=Artemisia annua TaxID=35608 RepID=A0A2U1PZL5_ARTAN|nr:NADH-ubiquinone oxidoreductase chain 2 [Artemisia annua]
MWAPDIYEGSPTPVTAFLSIAPKISISANISRLSIYGSYGATLQQIFFFCSIASMILGALAAMAQTKVKRLLAHSSIGHVGYIRTGFSCGTIEGIQSLLIGIFIYASMTIDAFAIVSALRQSRVKYIADLGALAKTNPISAITFSITMFSYAGIPPLAGFCSKFYLFFAALGCGAYFLAPVGVVTSVIGRWAAGRLPRLTYAEFPTKYVWNAPKRIWTLRKQGTGDAYYCRMLLNSAKGCRTHAEIRKVNGVIYPTYKEACYAAGLLEDDKEYVESIKAAAHWAPADHLRELFVTLLDQKELTTPLTVWLATWHLLVEDVQYKRRQILQIPDLIRLYALLTTEQKGVYDTIVNSVYSGTGGIYFVYGYGGTGKTFLWKILAAGIRRKGDIVLNVASSGIASLLMSGGRTAHSRFHIPINVDETSTCSTSAQSDLGAMLKKNPFGNMTMVFGGDFRQVLFVIPKGSRKDIVGASMKQLYLWDYCKILKLTANMRLTVGSRPEDVSEIREFAEWILNVGDGKLGGPNEREVR